jgi:fibronectin type 3 domain-containing protein
LVVTNAAGYSKGNHLDAMYDTSLFPFVGGNMIIGLTNLPLGRYDVVLYGHGIAENQNSAFVVTSYGYAMGPKSTLNGAGWDSVTWAENVQFVKFQSVNVIDGRIWITAMPGATSYAPVSGLQLVRTGDAWGEVPDPPSGLAATVSQTSITMSWNASEGAMSYRVQRGTTSGGPYFDLGTTTETFLVDKEVGFGSTYHYIVRAENNIGASAYSAEVSRVMAKGTEPSNLINIDFTAHLNPGSGGDKVGSAAIGETANDFWNIYSRDVSSMLDGRVVGTVNGLKKANGLTTGVSLTVTNADGFWSGSHPDRMFNSYIYPKADFGGNVTAKFSGIADGRYDLYVYGHGDATSQNSVFELLVGSTVFGPKTNLSGPGWNSVIWSEGVQYVKFSDLHVGSGSMLLTVKPGDTGYALLGGAQLVRLGDLPPPPTPQLWAVSGAGTVGLAWSRSVGANTYRVRRGIQSGGPYFEIGTSLGTGKVDTDVGYGQTYYYIVRAENSSGVSDYSEEVSITVPVGSNPSELINVDFTAHWNPGTRGDKVGLAAAGETPNDSWNSYNQDTSPENWRSEGMLQGLKKANGMATESVLLVTNAAVYSNGSHPDVMYNTYLYPASPNTTLSVGVTNLRAGRYNVYVYGHGTADDQNAVFELSAGNSLVGTKTNLNGPGWDSVTWLEGVQYVRFGAVDVVNGELWLRVKPGASGYAPLSGLQLMRTGEVPVPATLPPPVPTGLAAMAGASSVTLTWNPSPTASLYRIKRATQSGGPYFEVGTATGASRIDAPVGFGTTYYYVVRAENDVGPSAYSAEAAVTMVNGTDLSAVINVNFTAHWNTGSGGDKVGKAAVGETMNDFWNTYSRDTTSHFNTRANGIVPALKKANGEVTGTGLVVTNAASYWSGTHPDVMYNTHLYPAALNTTIIVGLTNVEAGRYDLYLYGHGVANNQNAAFELSVGGAVVGTKATLNGAGWNSPIWAEGVQYVKFAAVDVAGGALWIKVKPGASSYAPINGLQLVRTGDVPSPIPVITKHPISMTLAEGVNAIITVEVAGEGPFNYQWRKGTQEFTSVNSATFFLTNFSVIDQGSYTVEVSKGAYSVTSQPATLTMAVKPYILFEPDSILTVIGRSVSLSVTAVGTGPLHYQWRKNGEPLTDENDDVIPFLQAAQANTGTYDVVVSSPYGSTTSRAVSLQVLPAIIRNLTPAEVDSIPITGFLLKMDAEPGITFVIEYSEDLETWHHLATLTTADEQTEVMDGDAKNRHRRFYRVRVQTQ